MAFSDLVTALNQTCISTFSNSATPCIYFPASQPGNSFPIQAIALDPIRQENVSPGNFAIRWVQKVDLDAQGIVPSAGDVLMLEDGVTKYKIDTPQADAGGGIRFVMLKKAA